MSMLFNGDTWELGPALESHEDTASTIGMYCYVSEDQYLEHCQQIFPITCPDWRPAGAVSYQVYFSWLGHHGLMDWFKTKVYNHIVSHRLHTGSSWWKLETEKTQSEHEASSLYLLGPVSSLIRIRHLGHEKDRLRIICRHSAWKHNGIPADHVERHCAIDSENRRSSWLSTHHCWP